MPGSMVMDELLSDSVAVVETEQSERYFPQPGADRLILSCFFLHPVARQAVLRARRGNRQCGILISLVS